MLFRSESILETHCKESWKYEWVGGAAYVCDRLLDGRIHVTAPLPDEVRIVIEPREGLREGRAARAAPVSDGTMFSAAARPPPTTVFWPHGWARRPWPPSG